MKKCFECGEIATEDHHVIPRVMGGTKTIPLCTQCHMKVHGLDGTKRADNHRENTKRGIDKIRVWELFAVYQIAKLDGIIHPIAIKEAMQNEYDYEISVSKAQRLYGRLKESDEHYLQILFDDLIDSDLSMVWNEKDREIKDSITHAVIKKNIEKLKTLDESDRLKMIKEMSNTVNNEFLEYKRNNTSS